MQIFFATAGQRSAKAPRSVSLLGLVTTLSMAYGLLLCLAVAIILALNARVAIKPAFPK
jgi:ABC-type nickel/cobalt efflux system permease component RcnA